MNYRGKNLNTAGGVMDAFEIACGISMEEVASFMEQYDKICGGNAMGNLSYQRGNPYLYAYAKLHPLSKQVEGLKELLKINQGKIDRDYRKWSEENRHLPGLCRF